MDDYLICDMTFGNQHVGARIRNSLQQAGIMTLGQLLDRSERELLADVPNFGQICLIHLKLKLESMGLNLRRGQPW